MSTPQIVLDDQRSGGERIYARPLEVVRADAIGAVDAAFAKLEAALAAGRHAAGYFSYELGYALERRLVPLMPSSRNVPLLWVGIFADCEFGGVCADESAPRTHAGRLAH